MTAQLPLNNQATQSLYEKDFYLWLEMTAQLLRDRRLDYLDYDNLIEEIETMGRSEKQALWSDVKIVVLHLLKWKYQPECRSGSWKGSIKEHRRRIHKLLKDSPSLKKYLPQFLEECYGEAREDAIEETGLYPLNFPRECPFSLEQIQDITYLP
jgi:hypothetical protein